MHEISMLMLWLIFLLRIIPTLWIFILFLSKLCIFDFWQVIHIHSGKFKHYIKFRKQSWIYLCSPASSSFYSEANNIFCSLNTFLKIFYAYTIKYMHTLLYNSLPFLQILLWFFYLLIYLLNFHVYACLELNPDKIIISM